MKTIRQAFEDFLQTLELTDAEQERASGQHPRVREALQQRLDVDDNFLSGSYRRKTAIRPLNDIDLFIVLKELDGLNRASEPHAVLTTIKDTLEEAWPGKTAVLQARSVNIEFTGSGIAYDVVPAFVDTAEVYLIPDRSACTWIRTNPKVHAERSTAANEAAGKMLKPLVKALKQANREHDAGCRSFHLEVMAWSVLTTPPTSYLDGFITLLEGTAEQIVLPCPDPAGLGPEIQPSPERCAAAQTWLMAMATLAREAKVLAADGKTGAAHAKLREVFGSQWPERGVTAPRVASVVVSGEGVDGSGSRFG